MIENSRTFTRKFGIPIIAILMVIFTGCTNAIDPKLFYGIWQNTRDDGTMNVILSKESWMAEYPDEGYYYTGGPARYAASRHSL